MVGGLCFLFPSSKINEQLVAKTMGPAAPVAQTRFPPSTPGATLCEKTQGFVRFLTSKRHIDQTSKHDFHCKIQAWIAKRIESFQDRPKMGQHSSMLALLGPAWEQQQQNNNNNKTNKQTNKTNKQPNNKQQTTNNQQQQQPQRQEPQPQRQQPQRQRQQRQQQQLQRQNQQQPQPQNQQRQQQQQQRQRHHHASWLRLGAAPLNYYNIFVTLYTQVALAGCRA